MKTAQHSWVYIDVKEIQNQRDEDSLCFVLEYHKRAALGIINVKNFVLLCSNIVCKPV